MGAGALVGRNDSALAPKCAYCAAVLSWLGHAERFDGYSRPPRASGSVTRGDCPAHTGQLLLALPIAGSVTLSRPVSTGPAMCPRTPRSVPK
jgi:hypothetical protein